MSELEVFLKVVFIYIARTFGWWGILYAALAAFVLFLLSVLARHLPALPKIEAGAATTGDAAVLIWQRRVKPWLRKYLPAFLAAYIIMAGLAIMLGRFDDDAAFLGCPAVAAGVAYFFNRLRRA